MLTGGRRVAAGHAVAAQRRGKTAFKDLDVLGPRHNALSGLDEQLMLKEVNATDMDDLLRSVVPASIYNQRTLPEDGDIMGEKQWLDHFREMMGQNVEKKQCIGMGYHECKIPAVIIRNVLESPGWYTPYTPYQAEISQGRLESLMNFQQTVIDLTGFNLANASLLDEATAVGEAISLAVQFHKGKRKRAFIDYRIHPASIEVAKTRASGFNCEVVVGDIADCDLTDPQLCSVVVQYPDTHGAVHNYSEMFATARENKVLTCCAADLMSLTHLTPPGELGADIACGSTQRFGVPLGFGGPHAAYFATDQKYARITPGRIIGVSRDREGNMAFRMALQTREQHIKREKATSNICTAQALLANMAAMYAVWHGPQGLRDIGADIHLKAKTLAMGLRAAGFELVAPHFYDTVHVKTTPKMSAEDFVKRACDRGVNIRFVDSNSATIALDECTEQRHIEALLDAAGLDEFDIEALKSEGESYEAIPQELRRTSKYLEHSVFNSHHSETMMMRYIYKLQRKDLGLNVAMIPLGSCTMKLNAAVEMLPLTWSSVNSIHPFAPVDQTAGYRHMLKDLEGMLAEITGMDNTSLQPNAGAQGEYAGLRMIRAYQESIGEGHRDVCICPSSAHGTNPASAAMCGMRIAIVKCLPNGAIDIDDFKAILEKHAGNVSCAMITYPSTFGLFDENIKTLTGMLHEAGGQVYIDGANFNAQMGLSFPGEYGGDVLHLNLHKTFAIPHGGGGPGMGPICFKSHLAPFAPGTASPGMDCGGDTPFGQISQAAYGSASILPISYAYMKLLGWKGLRQSSEQALLNANYMRSRLSTEFRVLYTNDNGRCAHEFILDMRPFKKSAGVEVEDVAKRLMDYNFHAPTMSFPIAGTLMIEPTESESRYEMDRFVEAMLSIREEIRNIENGTWPVQDNPLKHAPHTIDHMIADWERPYPKEVAAYPVASLKKNKLWPSCSRIDSAFGDRNFMCSCPPIDHYV
eukprot:TRINITY_DN9042_c1_g1_i1.p1 TRINITY_DN9042_c1_g1~~TRINITY_DN9042_c1_g1_i1.p1  ORF type:complete len:978 (+),score=458.96 TRINITY_DN9042_c1_g1_i1:68-3001(+)